FELVPPGESFTYEFIAQPYGIMPYHCHSMPSSQHIHNGLYGMMIFDPKEGRPPMRELAMVMSAFDLDRDGEAEFYAWNGRAFQYADNPIALRQGEPVRMYVMNIFEEAMVPHLHGNLFRLYPSGTTMTPTEYTDVKTLSIAERAMLEFQYDYPGTYMFQCHVTEHMEQGLMGWFNVVEKTQAAQRRP
ncbi:MAG: multicopper oxidase domain-containing protein, partial [Candidatus Acidiferrales bacterium]